jgi:hypothetical protein
MLDEVWLVITIEVKSVTITRDAREATRPRPSKVGLRHRIFTLNE